VVGAIGAWNYPFQMACWKSGPALACGNTMVFKPAEWTPQSAGLLAEIYCRAGIPEGVFNVIQVSEFPQTKGCWCMLWFIVSVDLLALGFSLDGLGGGGLELTMII